MTTSSIILEASDQRRPLAACAPVEVGDGSFRIEERPLLAKLIVRSEPERAAKAIKSAVKCDLPEATQATSVSDHHVLWLGPDEYLVIGPRDSEAKIAAALKKSFGKAHHQIADVSDYYTTIRASGAFARDALARLSTLDLHPRSMSAGRSIGSMFGHAQAILHTQESPRGLIFDLYVRWSMASYLWASLMEAGRVKGLQAPPKMQVNWSINPE